MYKAVLFDAYGTLLDVDAAAANLAAAKRFPELATLWPELSALWRSRQLNYTWLRSLSNSYEPFWQLTCDSLDYAMEACNLADQDMRTALLDLYRELTLMLMSGQLDAVHAAGLPAAVLSNGNQQMIDHAFAAAGLTHRLDSLLSVEDVGVFKPDPRVYQLGCDRYQGESRRAFIRLFKWLGRRRCWVFWV